MTREAKLLALTALIVTCDLAIRSSIEDGGISGILNPLAARFACAVAVAGAISGVWFMLILRPQRAQLEQLRTQRDAAADRLKVHLQMTEGAPEPAWVARQVHLAAEHVEGISLLLDAARRNNRSVPMPALKNLAFLGKKLRELEAALGSSRTGDEAGNSRQPTSQRAERVPSEHRQPFGCRASPCDT